MSFELKTKANVVIVIALTALAGMSWLSLRENRNLSEADRWVSHTHDVLDASASLRSHMTDAAIARRLFTQGDAAQAGKFNVAVISCFADFEHLRRLSSDNNDQQQRLDRLKPLVFGRIEMLQQSIAAYQQSAKDDALQQNLTDQLTMTAAKFAEQVHQFESVERELLRQRTVRAEESARATSRADSILSLSVLCFIMIATAVLNREWSRRKCIEQTITEQKSLLQSILDTCVDAIIVADSSAKVILRNPAAVRLCGQTLDRVSEDAPKHLGFYHPDEATMFSRQELPLWRALQGNHTDNVEICVRPPEQEITRWVLASSRPLLSEKAENLGGVVYYRDVTDRKELETKLAKYAEELKRSNVKLQTAQVALERLASVDELTGLQNRRGFLTLSEQSVKLARRAQKDYALVFVDLDGLKKINDTLGHHEGDRAIADAALILRDSFRHCDVLGRLGGDEFAILMIDAKEESARILRNRITDKVGKLNAEGKCPYQLSLSIGMLLCRFDEKLPLETLLEKADALMYAEKKGKGACRESEVQHPQHGAAAIASAAPKRSSQSLPGLSDQGWSA
jgi:diguanylate cyclase (GGDEF)-like protein/PAS domain S-box-containing protein